MEAAEIHSDRLVLYGAADPDGLRYGPQRVIGRSERLRMMCIAPIESAAEAGCGGAGVVPMRVARFRLNRGVVTKRMGCGSGYSDFTEPIGAPSAREADGARPHLTPHPSQYNRRSDVVRTIDLRGPDERSQRPFDTRAHVLGCEVGLQFSS